MKTLSEVVTTTARSTTEITTPSTPRKDEDDDINQSPTTSLAPTVRKPEDVAPLNIFTSDIKYQRFPRPMSLTTLKNKVCKNGLHFTKKIYITKICITHAMSLHHLCLSY